MISFYLPGLSPERFSPRAAVPERERIFSALFANGRSRSKRCGVIPEILRPVQRHCITTDFLSGGIFRADTERFPKAAPSRD